MGASLLAIAVHQPPLMYLTWPHREQALSHRRNVFGQWNKQAYRFAHPLVKTPKK
ncbi:hypothetical protein SAMN03159439_05368 [Pseudomonas sp. NFACC04-2]|nr:hypothetical protein SAMN03159439_05368 [Pseudomonas sp. NFACC04-2]